MHGSPIVRFYLIVGSLCISDRIKRFSKVLFYLVDVNFGTVLACNSGGVDTQDACFAVTTSLTRARVFVYLCICVSGGVRWVCNVRACEYACVTSGVEYGERGCESCAFGRREFTKINSPYTS